MASDGRVPASLVTIAEETRESLIGTHAWKVVFPRRAILTFGVGAKFEGPGEPPGWGRVVVTLDGKEIARESINPRVAHDWKDVTVELDSPPEKGILAVTIRFTDKDGVNLEQPEALTLAVSEPVLHDRDAYGSARGIILISVDTLRRDHVSAYGYPKPTTPTIDGIAKRGVLVEDAVSVSSWTLPAHLTMLTSVLPGAHGGTSPEQGFNRSVPTLPELLRAKGFATHAVTAHLYVSASYGLETGFDSLNFRQDRLAENVANHAMDLIDRFGDRPFFLFLHFYDPHWHYAPPPRILKLFETSYSGKITGNLKDFQNLGPGDVKPPDVDHLLALYDAEIRYTDDQIGRLVTHLEQRNVFDNTLLFVTSDHGEEFLEHGSWEHQKTLYEEVIRIPMIAAGPGLAPRTESRSASLLDVAPTLLEFAGVAAPPGMQGVSLMRPITEVRETYGETDNTTDGSRLAFLRAGPQSWKALMRFDRKRGGLLSTEWYDLAVDPKEASNAPPAGHLRQTIETRARTLAVSFRSSAPRSRVQLSAEQIEHLRAMGYVK